MENLGKFKFMNLCGAMLLQVSGPECDPTHPARAQGQLGASIAKVSRAVWPLGWCSASLSNQPHPEAPER